MARLNWERVIGYREVFAHAAHQFGRFSADDPYERCGFLFSRRYGAPVSFIEVPNTHAEPKCHYRIGAVHYRQVLDTFTLKPGRRGLVGILHTHPGRDTWTADPSSHDFLSAQERPGLIHVVYHPYTRRVTIYEAHGVRDIFRVPARLRFIG